MKFQSEHRKENKFNDSNIVSNSNQISMKTVHNHQIDLMTKKKREENMQWNFCAFERKKKYKKCREFYIILLSKLFLLKKNTLGKISFDSNTYMKKNCIINLKKGQNSVVSVQSIVCWQTKS